MDTKDLKKTIDTLWPRTKKELERAIGNAKGFLDRSEASLKALSEKSAASVKELTLTIKKDKLYFELGKLVAATSANQWSTNKKITALLAEIKRIEREIKRAR